MYIRISKMAAKRTTSPAINYCAHFDGRIDYPDSLHLMAA